MAVTQHGLKCSSESARKLLSATGVPLSGDTVLRDIHRMSVPERCEVKEIGVDDWAFRKGVTYGSIIVSLETGSVIDLLGDRDVKSFQAWLDEHVQVEVSAAIDLQTIPQPLPRRGGISQRWPTGSI